MEVTHQFGITFISFDNNTSIAIHQDGKVFVQRQDEDDSRGHTVRITREMLRVLKNFDISIFTEMTQEEIDEKGIL